MYRAVDVKELGEALSTHSPILQSIQIIARYEFLCSISEKNISDELMTLTVFSAHNYKLTLTVFSAHYNYNFCEHYASVKQRRCENASAIFKMCQTCEKHALTRSLIQDMNIQLTHQNEWIGKCACVSKPTVKLETTVSGTWGACFYNANIQEHFLKSSLNVM